MNMLSLNCIEIVINLRFILVYYRNVYDCYLVTGCLLTVYNGFSGCDHSEMILIRTYGLVIRKYELVIPTQMD